MGRMEYLQWFWQTYPVLVDMALYFFVFGAASRVAFAKSFPGHEGKVLSVAVGLFLAAALAMAQRKLGFSTENLGPVAVFILCGIVFLASYKFIERSDVSKPVAVLLSALIAFALARAAMPGAVGRFVSRNPLTIGLMVAGLLFWAWQRSGAYAAQVRQRLPGAILARNKAVPSEGLLNKERLFVKKRLRNSTREDNKDEKGARRDLSNAQQLLEKRNLGSQDIQRAKALIETTFQRVRAIRARTARLFQLDDALRRFDVRWFRKTHGVDFGRLTPAEQKVLQETLMEERRRIHAEEELEKLAADINRRASAVEGLVARAKEGITAGNVAAATGWVNEAAKAEAVLKELEERALGWEKRLLRLIRREQGELTERA